MERMDLHGSQATRVPAAFTSAPKGSGSKVKGHTEKPFVY
jgi:hypothetical protein